MSGKITRFGTTTLPEYVPHWNLSIAAQRRTVPTIGGFFDPYRGTRAPIRFPYDLTVAATAYETTAAAFGVALDSYRALIGRRDLLWMTPFDTSQQERWALAVLKDVRYTGAYNFRLHQPMEFVFEMNTPWCGAGHGGDPVNYQPYWRYSNGMYLSLDTFTLLDSGTVNVSLLNDGNYPVRNAGLTIIAGGGTDITYLKLAGLYGLTEIEWSGTLVGSGTALLIDCGTHMVSNNGAAAYEGISYGANHKSAEWLEIPPGGETLTVTVTGASASSYIVATYAEQWA